VIPTPLAKHFGDREFSSLTPLDVDEWLHKAEHRLRDGKQKARHSRTGNATAFQRLQNWGIQNKLIEAKTVDALEKPKSPPRRTMPTDEEVKKVLAAASPEYRRFFARSGLVRSSTR
jgi:hypothetical protein